MARILVVEDDDRLRELLERQLTRLGHEVFAVPDVEAAPDRGRAMELAVVHLGVPGGGWERLGVPVVGISGGPRPVPYPPGIVDLLRKPYTLAELGDVIGRHTR
ncbi:hypothetical protein ACFS5L_05240 [Streptomyces phyllanthi]|uniref:Response regulatory domain-containing protein n=1 Tax=Streptomyces phyllanthi TaxID=1803180 RepID=A0A5N8VZM0_9ACTN|nr:hypothetical protein [Streptomyces phyllanthi]MPY40282.1 hypothetical protein [Streptomyces phyllanthi]